jgi:hypothetical protein
MEMGGLIIQACNEITEDIINNIAVRVEQVSRRNGGHTEHLIQKG